MFLTIFAYQYEKYRHTSKVSAVACTKASSAPPSIGLIAVGAVFDDEVAGAESEVVDADVPIEGNILYLSS